VLNQRSVVAGHELETTVARLAARPAGHDHGHDHSHDHGH
jgi:hypothetical protein